MTMIFATLLVALGLFVAVAYDRQWAQHVDRFLCSWLIALTAWPVIVIYAVAPALWSSADAAGAIFAVLLYGPAAAISVAAALHAVATHSFRIDGSAAILALLMVYACAAMILDGSGRIVNLLMSMALLVGFVFRYRSFELDDVARSARIALVATTAICWSRCCSTLLGSSVRVGSTSAPISARCSPHRSPATATSRGSPSRHCCRSPYIEWPCGVCSPRSPGSC